MVGEGLARWRLPAAWNSGVGWRVPQKSLGARTLRLPAGRHKLVMCFDDITIRSTLFCKLVFTKAAGGGEVQG